MTDRDLTYVRNRSSVPPQLRSRSRSPIRHQPRHKSAPQQALSSDLDPIMRVAGEFASDLESSGDFNTLRSPLPESLQQQSITTSSSSPMSLKKQLELTHAVPKQDLLGIHVSKNALRRANAGAACHIESTDFNDMQSLRLTSEHHMKSYYDDKMNHLGDFREEEEEEEDEEEQGGGVSKFFMNRVNLFMQNVSTIRQMATDPSGTTMENTQLIAGALAEAVDAALEE